MKVIQIDASPRQMSKLRNGHRVRIMAGSGLNLVVSPEKYNIITKAFNKNKGLNIALSPEELMINKEAVIDGSGLYKALSKVGIKKRDAINTFKFVGKEALKLGSEAVKAGLMSVGVPPQLSGPILDKLEKKGERAIEKGSTKQFKTVNPKNIKKFAKETALELLDQELDNLDPEYRMAAEMALDVVQNKPFQDSYSTRSQLAGYGLYLSKGGAILPFKGGAMKKNMSIINKNLPPALQSQNNSANFQMASRLPPQYQRVILAGSGLYM